MTRRSASRRRAGKPGIRAQPEKRVLADARHNTITDHPDAVMQAIRDLLDEVRQGSARP